MNKSYRITMAILADRSGGHAGPSSAYKPFGDVLRLPVSPDWLVGLKHRIVADYHGPTPLSMPEKPLVLYLQRQTDGRRLVEEDHEALIKELYKLRDDGIAEVDLEAFDSAMAFDEQVARISRATVSLSLSLRRLDLTHLQHDHRSLLACMGTG